MELQILETVDFDVEFAETLPNSAFDIEMHPVLATREAYLAEMRSQGEPSDVANMQSDQNEDAYQEVSCVPFPFVCVTITIKSFHTIDAEEWFVC